MILSEKTKYVFTILTLFLVACTNKSNNISLIKDIIITENSIKIENTYLANPFTINKFIRVLGDYSVKESLINDAYIWDNHGIKILFPNHSTKAIEINFVFKKSDRGSNPKRTFAKDIIIDSLSINQKTKSTNLLKFGFNYATSYKVILTKNHGAFRIIAFRDPESNELYRITIVLKKK